MKKLNANRGTRNMVCIKFKSSSLTRSRRDRAAFVATYSLDFSFPQLVASLPRGLTEVGSD